MKALMKGSLLSYGASKEPEESLPRVDFSVPGMHHDPSDLGLICLEKKGKMIKNPILDFQETHPFKALL